MDDTPKYSNLSKAKRDLLTKWIAEGSAGNTITIPKRPSGEIQLSFTQRMQLFLELIEPGTAVNNLSVCIEVKGELDYNILQSCVRKILVRHEVLRTCFNLENGLMEPSIADDVSLTINHRELKTEPDDCRVREEALELARDIAAKPFDLGSAPLVKVEILSSNNTLHYLVVVIHHLIADGWSLGVFLEELTSRYRARLQNLPDTTADLEVQYSDFAHWQINELQSGSFEKSLEYWRNKLKGDLPVLDLPFDKGRSSRQTFAGGTYRFDLPKDAMGRLEKIGRAHDSTMFMCLLSLYALLLHRYSGQVEIMIGTPIAGRNVREIEKLIGVFINTLVLRIELESQISFRELLTHVREISLEAFSHQDLPFERLVEDLKPGRDLSHSPIFQTVFNMQNSPMPELEIPGASLKLLEVDRGVSEVDLTLLIFGREKNYTGTVEFNSDLFQMSGIRKMFGSYLALLDAVVENPDAPISKLSMVTELDRTRLIKAGENLDVEFPEDKVFYELFEAQVLGNPNKMAVTDGIRTFTYARLNQCANTISLYLNEQGISARGRVAVCADRSAESIVVLLGIQKARAVAVPIHPSSPIERIKTILDESGAKLLIKEKSREFPGTPVSGLDLDEMDAVFIENREVPDEDPDDDLAYIMYTSGTTGTPKGVMAGHRSLMNFLWSMKDCPGICPEDVLLGVTPISFDITMLDFYNPLMVGATVIVARNEVAMNPARLAEAIDAYEVTILQATPATWQLLVDSGWKGKSKLKALCGGDVLTRKLADQILQRCGSLWNMYGPTETTVWTTIKEIKKEEVISVGKCINNAYTYLLDENRELVPQGVLGELYIGGEGVSRGYLKNPELTKERFVPDPFRPQRVIFRTGDQARYLVDYSIDLRGRFDRLVKMNCYTIELNGVEAVLSNHHSVKEAVVVVLEQEGRKKLVAYFVPAGPDYFPTPAGLRHYMREKLPQYMVPSVYVPLERFPLSTNGKIDRSALPEPLLPEDNDYVPPRNELEAHLGRIWEAVLQKKPIGVYDNFFDLGGASIQSIQIVALANSKGISISPEHIFEYQSIAGLADFLESNKP